MKKLFISQPMSGKSNEEILHTRDQAVREAKEVLKDDIAVIVSFQEDETEEQKPLWLLGKAFQLLSEADAVYFARGWDISRGCKLEHMAAIEYGVPIINH